MNSTIDNIQFPFFSALLMLSLRVQCEQNLTIEPIVFLDKKLTLSQTLSHRVNGPLTLERFD